MTQEPSIPPFACSVGLGRDGSELQYAVLSTITIWDFRIAVAICLAISLAGFVVVHHIHQKHVVHQVAP